MHVMWTESQTSASYAIGLIIVARKMEELMSPTIRKCFLVVTSLMLAGCISPKSFLDPSFPKVAYEDLNKTSEPLRIKLVVEFQRNGQPYPKADTTLRDNAERILRASGVIVPAADAGQGEVKIVVNNIADLGSASAKGFGTGLTFGLVGSTVTDAYELSIFITFNGKTISRTAVKHAIHTAIGNTSAPPNLEAVPVNVAFERVLEQMLLRALQDMQQSGELSWLGLPDAPDLVGDYRWLTITSTRTSASYACVRR